MVHLSAAGGLMRSTMAVHSVRSGLWHVQPQLLAPPRRPGPRVSSISGHLVEAGRGQVLDDALRLDVAEQGDLLARCPRRTRRVGAADDDVGLDAHAQQLLDGVLGGLGLVARRSRRCRAPGTTWMKHARSRVPCSRPTWRMASRKGWLSMSPMVPPISVMTTSALGGRARCGRYSSLISLVMWGMIWTVLAEVVALTLLVEHVPVDLAGGEVGDDVFRFSSMKRS